MRRINLPFENLRPIATDPHLRCADTRIGSWRESRCLEFAHFFRRPHVRPYKSAGFTRRVGHVLDPLGNEAVGRLGSHFYDVTFNIEFPAVIEAAKTALLIARKYQRCAPMRTVFVEYADTTLAVTKNNEILAQKPDLDRGAIRLGDLLGEAGRDPMAAHDLSHRGVALDATQQVVFLIGHHDGASSGAVAKFSRALFLRYLRSE